MPKRPILIEVRYRSRLEKRIADQLEREGIEFGYESIKVPYTVPERRATYTPDFVHRTIRLEAKGWLRATDRQKLLHVRNSNPGLDIRIVFQNARNAIYKGSPTTYAMWAEKNGFKWADKGMVPAEWIEKMKRQQSQSE